MCACGGGCPMCRGVKMMFVFKEKEQEMIKFEDVQIGDRVKLVNKNGDTAESTIIRVHSDRVYSELGCFWAGDGWSVAEILKKPKPMPNKPGTILRWTTDNSQYVKAGENWYGLADGNSYTENEVMSSYNPKKVVTEYEPK